MIIKGKNLRLYYWHEPKKGSMPGPANLKEIDKEQWGYELKTGQCIYALRYDHTGMELYFGVEILDVSEEGITIGRHMLNSKSKPKLIPWRKEFEQPYWENYAIAGKRKVMAELYVEPCDILIKENKIEDIINRKVAAFDFLRNGDIDEHRGEGMWYKHGGWRCKSEFEENLDNFVQLGQQKII